MQIRLFSEPSTAIKHLYCISLDIQKWKLHVKNCAVNALPLQENPSPRYPGWQLHVKVPTRLLHTASGWHVFVSRLSHSLMSAMLHIYCYLVIGLILLLPLIIAHVQYVPEQIPCDFTNPFLHRSQSRLPCASTRHKWFRPQSDASHSLCVQCRFSSGMQV